MPTDPLPGFRGGKMPWPPERPLATCEECGRKAHVVFIVPGDQAICTACLGRHILALAEGTVEADRAE